MESTLSFSIKKIEILNSTIESPDNPINISGFTFDIEFKNKIEDADNQVLIISDVVIKEQDQHIKLGRYTVACFFEVGKSKDAAGKEISLDPLPNPLMITLLGISISTVRGLMFGAFRGTFLHNAILPLVDLNALQHQLITGTN